MQFVKNIISVTFSLLSLPQGYPAYFQQEQLEKCFS